MTDTRTHPVADTEAKARAISEYKRDGYTHVEETDRGAVFERKSRGSLLAHLALFFTIGLPTLGIANIIYARRRARKTADRVEVVIDG